MLAILSAACLLALGAPAPKSHAVESISIPGTGASQTLLKAIAEHFNAENPDIVVQIPESSGSTGGIKSVMTGNSVLGRVSRALSDTERAGGLVSVEFARSPVVFISHPSVFGIDSLTIEEIRSIYSGATRRWSDLGGPERKIYPISRESGSIHGAILDHIPDFDNAPGAPIKRVFSILEIVDLVESFPYTIGFSSISLVQRRKINVLNFKGIEPSEAAVVSGRYPLIIPFALIHRRDDLPEGARRFLAHLKSPEAQDMMRAQGAVPLDGP
ncbi:MAG: substrate-binding domain-containing protein [Alphaproteobacteria bacterium]|nr:substrate-binding domain-containing protein [Alphaproteobacteria bacterium]